MANVMVSCAVFGVVLACACTSDSDVASDATADTINDSAADSTLGEDGGGDADAAQGDAADGSADTGPRGEGELMFTRRQASIDTSYRIGVEDRQAMDGETLTVEDGFGAYDESLTYAPAAISDTDVEAMAAASSAQTSSIDLPSSRSDVARITVQMEATATAYVTDARATPPAGRNVTAVAHNNNSFFVSFRVVEGTYRYDLSGVLSGSGATTAVLNAPDRSRFIVDDATPTLTLNETGDLVPGNYVFSLNIAHDLNRSQVNQGTLTGRGNHSVTLTLTPVP
jgi:hypothetical protein